MPLTPEPVLEPDLSGLVWRKEYAERAVALARFRREEVGVVDLVRAALYLEEAPIVPSERFKAATNYAGFYAGRELIEDAQDGHDELAGFSSAELWALRRLGRDAGRAWKPVFAKYGGPAFLCQQPGKVAHLLELEEPPIPPTPLRRPSGLAESD